MESLISLFLLLGAASDGSAVAGEGSRSRAHAVASAKILRGEVVDFGKPVIGRGSAVSRDRGAVFRIAPMRSVGEIAGLNGKAIRLQEFH